VVKQFLLNPDGSIPEGTNVDALIENNIPMVIPVPCPHHDAGVYPWELEPTLGEDGRLYQTWELRDYPNPELASIIPPAPNVDDIAQALASLTDEQKQLIIKALTNGS
jgi:hypothetical protein